jgi:hypothetical protein
VKLEELFKDHQLHHSEFQQDYFITARSGGTEYGMYKQSLRELHKRYRGLKELYAEKELMQIDIDELTEKKTKDKYEQKRNKIKHTQKIMAMEDLDKNIYDTEREFKRFYQQAFSLKEKIGELTDVKRDMLDRDMWVYKIKEMAAIDFISQGCLKSNTIELIMSVPFVVRKELLAEISDKKTLINWLENKQDVVVELKEIDIKKLMEGV